MCLFKYICESSFILHIHCKNCLYFRYWVLISSPGYALPQVILVLAFASVRPMIIQLLHCHRHEVNLVLDLGVAMFTQRLQKMRREGQACDYIWCPFQVSQVQEKKTLSLLLILEKTYGKSSLLEEEFTKTSSVRLFYPCQQLNLIIVQSILTQDSWGFFNLIFLSIFFSFSVFVFLFFGGFFLG